MELTTKLKLDKGLPLMMVQIPPQLAGVFADFTVFTGPGKGVQAVLFATGASSLANMVGGAIARLKEDAILWLLYPKKSSSIPTDLSRDNGWDVVFKMGYEPVTSVAVDNDWTALRFKKKEQIAGYIRGIPMEERQVEGIDFKNRTVTLPADALLAVRQHEGLEACFNALAFTPKKEHAVAIAQAKKPETRAARIAKMVTMLQQKMKEKQAK